MSEARGTAGLTRRQFLELGAATSAAIGATSVIDATSRAAESAPATTLRVGWNSPPDVLNPFTYATTASAEILNLIYDPLLQYDIHLNAVPALATHVKVSEGGKAFTYTLRPNAKWHDGKPVTTADVAFSYDVVAKGHVGQFGWTLNDYLGCTITSPTVITIRFKAPQAFNAAPVLNIVPKHIWGALPKGKLATYPNAHPVGSGPFTFGSWKQGQSVQVNRNPAWWGPAPAVASIIWEQFDNDDVMVQSLESGQIDIIAEVPSLLWKTLKGKANVAPISMESFSFHHIGFNVSTSPKSGANPLIRDRTVRQALCYAFDRQQFVDLCLAGLGQPGSVLLPPSFGFWQEAIPAHQQLDNNPTKANAMLDAAGYKRGAGGIRHDAKGNKLSFRLIAIQTTNEDVLAGRICVQRAAAIGIELQFQTLDATTLNNVVYNAAAPNWDMFIWGWDSGAPDPDYLMSIELTSQIGGNADVFYSNKRYDALYAAQAVQMNKTQRAVTLHQMQKLFYEDAAYCIMWYQAKLQAYRTDTWKGWRETTGGAIYNFTRANYLSITPA
jgi:peptide/nickel transport system substrate-binding protein